MDALKIGIIGCGTVAETCHLPALRRISKVEVQALADINERNARLIKRKFGLEDVSIYKSHKHLLEDADVEAVWVLTPPQTHSQIVIDSIKAGKHVLCEKPLATSSREAEAISKILDKVSRSEQLTLMPAHNFVFTPCFERALNILREGEIGNLREVWGRAVSNLAFYRAKTDFRLKAKGGVIEDQMPHLIYLTQELAGSIERVISVKPHTVGRPITHDVDVKIKLRENVTADLSAAWSGLIPTLKINLVGESGRLEIDLLRTPYNLTLIKEGQTNKINMGRRILQYLDVFRGKHPSYFLENLNFIESVMGYSKPKISLSSGVHLVRVLEAIMEEVERSPYTPTGCDIVALVKVDSDIEGAIRRSIALLGGLRIKKDAHVVIKPNICFWKNTENMIITDPKVLEATIKIVKERTKKITVVESDNNSGTADERLSKTGVLEIIEDSGANFVNLSQDRCEDHKIAGFTIKIPKTVLEADYLINLPKMKTCNIANVMITIAMKNMFGVIADRKKMRLHKKLVEVLLYINRLIRQNLIIVDGITAMEGLGPIWGTPVHLNLIVAGLNPVTVDSACCYIMGINPYSVEVLWRAYKLGMGEINIERIRMLGERFEDVKRNFSHPTFLKKNIIGAIRTALKTYI